MAEAESTILVVSAMDDAKSALDLDLEGRCTGRVYEKKQRVNIGTRKN